MIDSLARRLLAADRVETGNDMTELQDDPLLQRIINSNDELSALYDAYIRSNRTADDRRTYLRMYKQWQARRDVLVREYHEWRRTEAPAE